MVKNVSTLSLMATKYQEVVALNQHFNSQLLLVCELFI